MLSQPPTDVDMQKLTALRNRVGLILFTSWYASERFFSVEKYGKIMQKSFYLPDRSLSCGKRNIWGQCHLTSVMIFLCSSILYEVLCVVVLTIQSPLNQLWAKWIRHYSPCSLGIILDIRWLGACSVPFFSANACSVASTIISSTSIVRLSEAMAKPGRGGCGCPTSARRNRQGQFLVQTAKHRMFYMGTRTCHSGWFPMKWRDTAWLININESWSGHAMEDNYLPLLVSAQAKSMSHA